MSEEDRAIKRNKFGGTNFVYQKDMMKSLKEFFEQEIGQRFPESRVCIGHKLNPLTLTKIILKLPI